MNIGIGQARNEWFGNTGSVCDVHIIPSYSEAEVMNKNMNNKHNELRIGFILIIALILIKHNM